MNIEDGDFDLEADLAAALDGTANQTPKQAEEQAPENETPAEEQERLYRRDGRRFVPKEEEKAAKAEEKAVADEQQQQPPPKQEKRPTWYKDEYGDWNKLPENFRTALREQERNAAQAIEKHSTAAKQWEPVQKVLEPRMAQLQAAGVSGPQYVQNLVAADDYLQRDPVAATNWLVQSYLGQHLAAAGYSGDVIGLAQWMYDQNYQQQKPDPNAQKIAELEQKLSTFENQSKQATQTAAQKQIADWARDKPDFEAVRKKMAALANQNPEASLDDLYEEARWAHPEIRERILAEREDKRAKELMGKRSAGAQSPRGNFSGEPVQGRFAKARTSVEDDVAAAYDAAHGAV